MNVRRESSIGTEVKDPELRGKLARLWAISGSAVERAGSNGAPAVGEGEAEALFARIAWSRLTEPGDGTAGTVLAALGPVRALELLISGAAAPSMIAEAGDSGCVIPLQLLEQAIDRWLPRLDRDATVADIDRALTQKLTVVTPEHALWPTDSLGGLGAHVPTMLWLRGNPDLLRSRSLSVVGARAATGYGSHVTAELVDGVCAVGLTIVSGAAYGVDAVAHRTALAAQALTVAVLAGGADRAYPAAHDALLERIGAEGLVCSEMVPGSAPTRWRFRMRNRLIAALSEATLVTEAGVRSGTLNTAGHAAELGRTLCAVPGPVTSAASAGCHKLIREYGATLVTNAVEVCELIGISDRLDIFGADEAQEGAHRMPPLHERVLDALPLRGARSVSEIARRAGLELAEARGGLAELELLGRVRRNETPGGEEQKWSMLQRR